MATTTVSVDEAGSRLGELIKLVRSGNEVVLVENDQPQARLVGVPPRVTHRVFGRYKGRIEIADDFDAPLPDEFWFGKER